MKVIKKVASLLLIATMVFSYFASFQQNVEASAEYEIVFKAGLHGTINGKASLNYRVPAGDRFPNEPTVVAEDGYVFTGWNKALPGVNTPVESKQVFVAKYDVLVDGISYIVHYVDEKGSPIATPKTMMGEAGSKIVERAKVISEYAYEKETQQFTLSEKTKEITFVYNFTGVRENIRYEEEIINEVVPGQTTGTTGGNQGTQGDQGNVDVTDPDTPQGDINVDDPEVPQGKADADSSMMPIVIGSVGGIALLAILAYFIVKKRREEA